MPEARSRSWISCIDESTEQQVALDRYELASGTDKGGRGKLRHAINLDAFAIHLTNFLRQKIEIAIAGDQNRR